MTLTPQQLQAVITGTEEQRIEALRSLLNYPVKLRDPEGSRFWYLRPGDDELDAEETCPIAVGFYDQLDNLDNQLFKQWVTEPEQDTEIRGHYINRIVPDQPVLYLLLPYTAQGRVAFILPSEGNLRQRNIQTFAYSSGELINQFQRLHQGTLTLANKIQDKIIGLIPQVDGIFYTPAKTAKELAEALAKVTRRRERAISNVYHAETKDGYLHNLLVSFQKELLPNLKLSSDNEKDYSFADIYAQTIAYGLFTARVFSFVKNPDQDFNRTEAWQQLPETNPFLVDELLKDKFNKPLGLADPEVMILDPATGTGTFLLWICQLIHKRFQESPELLTEGLADKSWSGYVTERLLPRIFGFELLMAPYAICHLKLGLFLEETGYEFKSGKRLGVYLINTLEDIKLREEKQQLSLNIPQMEELIAAEAKAGSRIKKNEPIMVVIGNPPYSGHSENNNDWIRGLVNDYYFVDGKPLGEKNPKWLQDDYVKFIRFAQWRIDKSGHPMAK